MLNDSYDCWGIKDSLNLILDFGFNKGLSNLNNNYTKSNQFCKGLK
jgi:hypothetical protein